MAAKLAPRPRPVSGRRRRRRGRDTRYQILDSSLRLFSERGVAPPPRRAMLVMQANRDFLRLVFMESLGSEPGAMEEARSVIERWEQGVARVLRVYMERGQVRRLDAHMAARQLVTLARGAFMGDLLGSFGPCQSSGETLSPDLEAYLAASVDNILNGLLPCPS